MMHWVLAATLICGLNMLFTACSSSDDDPETSNAPTPTDETEKADYAIL